MFSVVNDVSAYPSYLPWCAESEILEQSEDIMTARLTIARSGIRQAFTTRNFLNRPEAIRLTLVEGSFKLLEGDWRFTQLGGDGCRIEMNLTFDIDSKLAGAVLGSVFEKVADTLVDAFCQRADELYR